MIFSPVVRSQSTAIRGRRIETRDAAPASGAWRYTATTALPANESVIIEAIGTPDDCRTASLYYGGGIRRA
ncbi:MAG: hypothetical protein Q7S40_17360 [Opitutaceae bacterium]|nr:hypothetical protein [Opitutaceae bacterium]